MSPKTTSIKKKTKIRIKLTAFDYRIADNAPEKIV